MKRDNGPNVYDQQRRLNVAFEQESFEQRKQPYTELENYQANRQSFAYEDRGLTDKEIEKSSLSATEIEQYRERERVGYYSEHALESRTHRDLSVSWDVNVTLNILSPDRWPQEWNEMLSMLSNRFEDNVASKIFDSYLWNASVANRGIDRDFEFDGHWTRRKLNDLPTAGATALSVNMAELVVYSVEGNAPTGMPSSAPSTSTPTTVRSRLEAAGLLDVDLTVSSFAFLPHVALILAALIIAAYNYHHGVALTMLREALKKLEVDDAKAELYEAKRRLAVRLQQEHERKKKEREERKKSARGEDKLAAKSYKMRMQSRRVARRGREGRTCKNCWE